jgi:threonine/homoserine/homoserine lactone efflux protein
MDITLLYALLVFAFVTSVTPGPNNLMLLASGANFGLRRTLPHMLGISLGYSFMVSVIGLGLAQAFQRLPILHNILLVISIAYMLWLAWKIAHANAPHAVGAESKPFTFWQAVAFQWVNPKAWIMAITAQTNYAQREHWSAALLVGLAFLVVNFPAISIWAWLGREMQRILTNPRRLTAFNWSMAALLVASMLPILFH